MLALILSTQLLPIRVRLGWWRGGRLEQGRAGIDLEIAIVRMLLAEVVAGLRFGLTSGENRLQLLDKLLQVLASKFPTKAKHQSWYAAHGGESLGNLAGSPTRGFGKRDFTAFAASCQPHRGSSSLSAARPLQSQIDPDSVRSQGGESRNASFSHQFNKISV
jgi:hypothetical protein